MAANGPVVTNPTADPPDRVRREIEERRRGVAPRLGSCSGAQAMPDDSDGGAEVAATEEISDSKLASDRYRFPVNHRFPE